MRAVMPWLEDSDAPACRAWAELEVLASRVYAELRDRGVVGHKGEARSILDDYRRLRSTQIILSRELGMTPAARMSLGAMSGRSVIDIPGSLVDRVIESAGPHRNGARGGENGAVAADPDKSLSVQPNAPDEPIEGDIGNDEDVTD